MGLQAVTESRGAGEMNVMRTWTKWIAGFDPHGVYQDKASNDAFFKFLDLWKPAIRIAGGDIWDFKQLRKKADAYEKRESMAVDVQAGKEWLERLQPTHYLRGNHCERLWDLAQQSEGIVADYAKLIVNNLEELVTKMRCQMFPYNKREGVMRLGDLKVIHGYRAGITAARMSAKTYGSVLMGHGHQIQQAAIEGLDQRTGFMGGCLCKLELEYNRAQEGSLTWEHGFPYGVVDLDSGLFQLWQARELDGKWLLPTGIEEL